jgi:ribosomal protein S18 acetylase RimI-like enzyme
MPSSVQPQSTVAPVESSSAPRIVVRRATLRDLDAVVLLRLALLREYPDHPIYGRLRPNVSARARELFGAQLRSSAESIFLADIDHGELVADARMSSVGILRCTESTGSPLLEPSRYAYVSSVYVRPDARRHGVLRALLSAADEWSRARGLDEMRLHNVADSESAEGAWAALGFHVVEHVRLRRMNQQER